ncbi:IS3 family transposase [Sphingobacterium faecium]|uniref:IS3 family transposase n=1 Tax=Sphingobacterium faecium TaxID=34087 RepID=UPI001885955A|nr:IS3 family transposase [Sphingobacterium faecium]
MKGLVADYRLSLRKACELSLLSTYVWYYIAQRREDLPLRLRIRNIAETRVRSGFWRVYILLRREGWSDNRKRVHRIFKEEGLNL